MAYTFQMKDAQNSVAIKSASNVVPTSPQFYALVNEGQRRLSRRGDFFGMTQVGDFVFQGSSITWSRYVGTILGVRSKHHCGIRPQNMWYSFTGSFHGHHHQWHADMVLEDAGMVCLYNDISGGGSGQLIRFFIEKGEDVGKTITLYGRAYGNQPLRHQDASGNWVDGLVLTAALPYATTTIPIIGIESVVKQPMQGNSRLYEYDTPSDTMRDLALYEPNETNPKYRRSTILNFTNRFHQPDGSTPKYSQVSALVKLAFIPVASPLDFLMVDNFDALKLSIQAVKAEEANDNATAEVFWAKAIRELNFEDRDRQDDNMVPIYVNATMAHQLHNPL